VKIIAGKELGLSEFQAMQNLDIVKGQVTPRSVLIASKIKQSERYDYKILKTTREGCCIEFFEDGESQGRWTYTIDDAKAAGLTGKDNWKKNPADMCFYRAMSGGYKKYCPDVMNIPVYTKEEAEEIDLETDGSVSNLEALKESTQPQAAKTESKLVPKKKPAKRIQHDDTDRMADTQKPKDATPKQKEKPVKKEEKPKGEPLKETPPPAQTGKKGKPKEQPKKEEPKKESAYDVVFGGQKEENPPSEDLNTDGGGDEQEYL